MKLKQIEITGFKSFLEKTLIHFPDGISAVVGPNGCGKSNVFDALRWVMGEQSVKQLRGKAMEDVIFAGASNRAACNMAEVSLTLGNESGNAPDEFKDLTEIRLTRRLYRSGDSAYLINRQPCRLKDIHNLFLGSGMGARSYTVIQQGNIGAITDADPQERRVFIEEAAGTTRYKARKAEALRKVEATHQNLLRLADIISEINRQMAALQRQVQKAERYRKYQARIRKYDICLKLVRLDAMNARLTEMREMLQTLQTGDQEQIKRLHQLDAEIEKIKLARLEKDRDIAAQKQAQYDLQRNADRLEAEQTHLQQEITRLTREIEELGQAHTALGAKNAGIADEMQALEAQQARLAVELQEARLQLNAQRAASQSTRTELQQHTQELESAKNNLMPLVGQEARYHNMLQNVTTNRENVTRRIKKIDEELLQTQQRVSELAAALQQYEGRRQELQQELESIKIAVRTTEAELQETDKNLKAQVKRVQTLEIERSRQTARRVELGKLQDNFEWYQGGVKIIMQQYARAAEALSNGATTPPSSGSGVLGLVADMLDVQPGYELAVEAALGEALQYVLVSTRAVALDAITFLRDRQAGRCGFIPLEIFNTPEARSGSLPDVRISSNDANALLNRVSMPAPFEAVPAHLLGHVQVVSDLSTTHSARPEMMTAAIPGPAAQVTLTGELRTARNFYVGGSGGQLSGILLKKQEIKTLDDTIAAQQSQIAEASAVQKTLEASARRLEIALQEDLSEKNLLQQAEIGAEKACYKAGEELKHAERNLDIVQLEQDQLLGEEADLDHEMERCRTSLAGVRELVEQAQAEVARLTDVIETLKQQAETFNQAVMTHQMRLTSLTAEQDNTQKTLRRLQDYQQDGQQRFEQLSSELAHKRPRLEESQLKIAENRATLTDIYSAMRQLEGQLEGHAAESGQIDAELDQSDRRIADIQQQREAVFAQVRVLELEISQVQIKQEALSQDMQERYRQPLETLRREGAASDAATLDEAELESRLNANKDKISRLTDVNLGAIKEYAELKERFDFMETQRADLVQAIADLEQVIRKINRITQERFMETFTAINNKLQEVFPRLFEGGAACLVLTEPNKPLETGVEFMIEPPGKKLTRLSLLSGGEKALSAIAFIFSIFLMRPAAFCLMDEIDAPLDEANVLRFSNLLKMIGEQSQVVMITHNKRTMEFADLLLGITMEQKGVSKVVSVNLRQAQAFVEA